MGCCLHSLPCMLARPAGVQSASSAASYATNTASAGPQRVDRFDEPWRTIRRDRHRRLEPTLAQSPQHPFRPLPGSHYWSLRESERPSAKPHRGPEVALEQSRACLCVRLTRYCPLGHTGGSFGTKSNRCRWALLPHRSGQGGTMTTASKFCPKLATIALPHPSPTLAKGHLREYIC
jgi:hypothetical protein